MQYAKMNVDCATQRLHDAQEKFYQSWLEWNKRAGNEYSSAEEVESRTLTIACSLAKCLQTTCVTLLSGLQCLPLNFQKQAYHVSSIAGDLYQNFNLASSFRDVSDSLLATSKEQLDKMKESLDDMMDYVVSNTPLNWLVPDFAFSELSSESDMQDIFDLDEDYALNYVHTNGHVNPIQAE